MTEADPGTNRNLRAGSNNRARTGLDSGRSAGMNGRFADGSSPTEHFDFDQPWKMAPPCIIRTKVT